MQFYMTRHALLGFGLAVGLVAAAGCAPSLADGPTASLLPAASIEAGSAGTAPAQTCPAKDLQYLVGQPRTVLYTMRFGTEVRFEEPGQIYTQEFKPNRIRIVIAADGKIERILCG